MRQKLSFVLVLIAALLVLGAKVVAPAPGSPRTYFTSVKVAVPSEMKRVFQTSCYQSDVRYWPKADMGCCTAHVRFQG